jgi:hypothetical protein
MRQLCTLIKIWIPEDKTTAIVPLISNRIALLFKDLDLNVYTTSVYTREGWKALLKGELDNLRFEEIQEMDGNND